MATDDVIMTKAIAEFLVWEAASEDFIQAYERTFDFPLSEEERVRFRENKIHDLAERYEIDEVEFTQRLLAVYEAIQDVPPAPAGPLNEALQQEFEWAVSTVDKLAPEPLNSYRIEIQVSLIAARGYSPRYFATVEVTSDEAGNLTVQSNCSGSEGQGRS
jgi:hypothetical protein